jgi:hypothetical protein
LLGRKKRVTGLRDSCGKDVPATDVDALAGGPAEFLIKLCWILAGKLFYAADAEKFKIAKHRWPY